MIIVACLRRHSAALQLYAFAIEKPGLKNQVTSLLALGPIQLKTLAELTRHASQKSPPAFDSDSRRCGEAIDGGDRISASFVHEAASATGLGTGGVRAGREPQRAAKSDAESNGGPQRRTRPSPGARGGLRHQHEGAQKISESAARLRATWKSVQRPGPARDTISVRQWRHAG